MITNEQVTKALAALKQDLDTTGLEGWSTANSYYRSGYFNALRDIERSLLSLCPLERPESDRKVVEDK